MKKTNRSSNDGQQGVFLPLVSTWHTVLALAWLLRQSVAPILRGTQLCTLRGLHLPRSV